MNTFVQRSLFLGCWLLSLVSLAQTSPELAVRVVGKAKSDRILLRWVPTSETIWQTANTAGYYVERRVVRRNGQPVTESFSRLTVLPLKPRAGADWQPNLRLDADSTAWQTLYSTLYEADPTQPGTQSNTAIVVTQTSTLTNQRYVMGLLAADLSFAAAQYAALGYVDTTVLPGERYEYRVVPVSQTVSTPGLQLGLADYQPLAAPARPQAAFGRQIVGLTWQADTTMQGYNVYWIERSLNGVTFSPRNLLPFLPSANADKTLFYQDSLPKGRQTYYFRIKAKTIFDEYGLSPVVFGQSKDEATGAPKINDIQWRPDGAVRLDWQFPGDTLIAHADTLLTGFYIAVAPSASAKAIPAAINILPGSTSAVVSNYAGKVPAGASLYFTVGAVRKDGDTLRSFPVFITPLDTIPPAAPTGLRGVAATNGLVYLSWQPNPEPDLLGYKVLRFQRKGEEPSVITKDSVIVPAAWQDTIALDLLNPLVFYQVKALDQRYNESPLSLPVSIVRPDTIPPAAPVFIRYDLLTAGVRLRWENSFSRDVVRHLLYRKEKNGDWEAVTAFSGSSDTTYADGQAVAGKRYTYLLLAEDGGGLLSDSSATIRVDIPVSAGVQKPVLAAFNGQFDAARNAVVLDWAYDATGVAQFEIYRATGKGRFSTWRMVAGRETTTDDDNVKTDSTYQYRMRAVFTDGTASNWQSVTVTAYGSGNQVAGLAPAVLLPVGEQTGTVGQPFSFSVPAGTFAAAAGHSLQSVIIQSTGVPGGLLASGNALTGTPQQAGYYTITIKATDNTGISSATSFGLTIEDAPKLLTGLSPYTATIGEAFQYTIPLTAFYDQSGSQVSVVAATLPAGVTAVGTLLSGTLTAAGPYSLSIQAVNAQGARTTTTLQLYGNRRPVVQTPLITLTALTGQPFSWTLPEATFTDADGILTQVVVSPAGMPAGLSAQGNTLTGTPKTVGSYTLTAIATDNQSATATARIALQVLQPVNQPPVVAAAIASRTVIAGETIQLVISENNFFDPDGQITALAATGLPAGLVSAPYSRTAGVLSLSGAVNATGSYSVTIQATDDRGATVSATWLLTVAGINQPPVVVTNLVPQTAVTGQSFAYTIPAGTFTDPEGGSLTVSVTGGLPAGLTFANGTLSGTPNAAGSFTVTVQATDGQGATVTTPLIISVRVEPPAIPVLSGSTTLCSPGSATLLASNCNGTVQWSTGQTGSSLIISTSVTAWVSASCVLGNQFASAAGSLTVTVGTAPVATISGGNTTICAGQSVSLVASGASSVRWSTGDQTAALTVTPVSTQTFTATVSTSQGCSASATTTVYVKAAPVVSIARSSTVNLCAGSSLTLTAGSSGGLAPVTYAWSTGSTAPQIAVSPTANTGYSVTATTADGCSRISSTTISVTDLPVVSPGTNKTICQGESAILMASGGNSYRWSTGATTPSTSVTAAGVYSVTVSNEAGCSSIASTTLTVVPSISLVISGRLALCQGESTTLTASGGTSYVWSTGATTAGIPVNVTATTVYNVTATTAGGCQALANATVMVNPPATPGISGNLTLCAGQGSTLIASGGNSYRWSTGSTAGTLPVSTAGIYSLTAVNAQGCAGVISATVTQVPAFTTTIAGNLSLCSGTSASLTAQNGSQYQWNTGALTAGISTTAAGIYSVTATSVLGCTAVASVTVTQRSSSTATIAGNLTTCIGQPATLTATGGTSYVWSSGQTGAAIAVAPLSTTVYSVTATSLTSCPAVQTAVVTILPVPVLTAVSLSADPQRNNVLFSLKAGDGNISQNSLFIDSSTNPYSVSVNGSPAQGTPGPSPGLNSAYFNGTGGLSLPHNAATSPAGDFTWETWFYTTDYTVINSALIAKGWPGNGLLGPLLFLDDALKVRFYASSNGTSWDVSSTVIGQAVRNTWQHVAVSRQGSTFRLFFNGQLVTTVTSSANIFLSNLPMTIGQGSDYSQGRFTGYLAGTRISNTARYTAGFTPPVSYTADAAAQVLLSYANAGIVDVAAKNAVQAMGDARVDAVRKPLGESSVNFDGSGDFLRIADNGSYNIGTSDFTVDGWVYQSAVSTGNCLIDTRGGANGFAIFTNLSSTGRRLSYHNSTSVLGTSSVDIPLNQWVHVAVQRRSGVITGYMNGKVVFTATDTRSIGLGPAWWIGQASDQANFFTGNIYDLRWTKAARYDCEFVPSLPVTASPSTTICAGVSVTLNAGGGDSFVWSTGATSASLAVSPQATTVYSVSVGLNTAAGPVTIPKPVTVVVAPPPAVTGLIAGNLTTCAGFPVGLTASGGTSYVWSEGQTGSAITVSPAATRTYSVTMATATGCAAQTVTVTVLPLPVISASSPVNDPLSDQVVFSMKATGAHNSQNSRFTDSSPNNVAVSVNGTPAQSLTGPVAGMSSGFFNGTGGLSLANSNYTGTAGDFTWETWLYTNDYTTVNAALMTKGWPNTLGPLLYLDDALKVRFYASSNGTAWDVSNSVIGQAVRNTWQHVAVSRQGSTFRLFFNGQLVSTFTNGANIFIGSLPLTLGQGSDNAQGLFTGYLAGTRISGNARYTASFTPPTALTADASTNILLNYTDAGVVDVAGKSAIATAGDTKVSTTQKPLGEASVSFDGNGDFIRVADNGSYNTGTSDFTVDGWFFQGNPATGSCLMDTRGGANGFAIFTYHSSTGRRLSYHNSTSVLGTSQVDIPVNQWVHFAVQRRNGLVTGYMNGKEVFSVTDNRSLAIGSTWWIGQAAVQGSFFAGNLYDLRWTRRARYTCEFVPAATIGMLTAEPVCPGQSATLVAGGGDSYLWSTGATSASITVSSLTTATWSVTATRTLSGTVVTSAAQLTPAVPAMLTVTAGSLSTDPLSNQVIFSLKATGAPNGQNNRFTDSSPANLTVSAIGLPTQTQAGPAPGLSSGYFNGTGGLSIPHNTSLHTTGDFTWETWFYTNDYTTVNAALMTKGWPGVSSMGPLLFLDDALKVRFYASSTGTSWDVSSTVIGQAVRNTWQHVAVSRQGSTFRLFFNGQLVTSFTSTANIFVNSLPVTIGQGSDYAQGRFTGYLAGTRISGSALYTASFTPPVSYTADASTRLLLTYGNAGVVDLLKNAVVTAGDARVDAVRKPLGESSVNFDGSGDFLRIADNGSYNIGTSDFTVDGWVYQSAVSTGNCLIDTRGGANGFAIFTNLSSTGRRLSYHNSTSVLGTSSVDIPLNQWVHVAVQRRSGVITGYMNGKVVFTVNDNRTLSVYGSWWIGESVEQTNYFTGNLYDLRWTKAARYSCEFSLPPTQ